ncbi:MAG: chorismate synthase [Clostridiales Family XIII bacterium]|jgi:chorismate synthase|nr:chorismate synthase [Clostridiales Family XIII bacterium]
MNSFGERFRVTIFGESHGAGVGVVVDGMPAGYKIDSVHIAYELSRRAPGHSPFSTERVEADEAEVVSGVVGGVSTGAPIACIIWNTDTRPGDYRAELRPGQADWTALLKYKGFDDRRGGGRFSGRLTAGLVFAGALAKQVLARRGVEICGRIKAIGGDSDDIDLSETVARPDTRVMLRHIAHKRFPCADEVEEEFTGTILLAKDEMDSVGGVVETVCFELPGGVGEPFFASLESHIARMLFSVPAVKGVEFGSGFHIADLLGSEANDPIVFRDGKLASITNNNGGILGGISNGMPIIVRAAIKPTPTIGIVQRTVDPRTMEETVTAFGGRHDPCIVPRAVPVVESAVALAVLDLMMVGGFA